MQALLFRRRLTWLVFATCLILNLVFVTTQGAWQSDLAGDPDEAAHAVTSLMLRDYLAGGWKQPPMTFAQQYYADFPKVALGHYPPGYYLLAGAWMLPGASVPALFVLQAALGAALCAVLYRIVSKAGGTWAGVVSALLMSMLPTGLKQIQLVMSDTLVVLLGLTAALIWRDYLNRPTVRRSLGFGLVAAAAGDAALWASGAVEAGVLVALRGACAPDSGALDVVFLENHSGRHAACFAGRVSA
jgi:hypothetical protein